MARGLNKAQIIGNLGDNPKITRKDDFIVARISVATSESWNDKNGNKVEHTEWHKIALFGKLAKIVEQHVHKGDKIYIEGRMRTNKYTDKDGIEKYSMEILADRLEMLGSASGKERKDTNPYGQQTGEEYAHAQQQHAEAGQYEDDIPF